METAVLAGVGASAAALARRSAHATVFIVVFGYLRRRAGERSDDVSAELGVVSA